MTMSDFGGKVMLKSCSGINYTMGFCHMRPIVVVPHILAILFGTILLRSIHTEGCAIYNITSACFPFFWFFGFIGVHSALHLNLYFVSLALLYISIITCGLGTKIEF